jgi:hypothetical protein
VNPSDLSMTTAITELITDLSMSYYIVLSSYRYKLCHQNCRRVNDAYQEESVLRLQNMSIVYRSKPHESAEASFSPFDQSQEDNALPQDLSHAADICSSITWSMAISPHSSLIATFTARKRFMNRNSFGYDASYGHLILPAFIKNVFYRDYNISITNYVITETLLFSAVIPDFSMPFNVITLVEYTTLFYLK